MDHFQPEAPVLDTLPRPSIRATVIIPARNEEQYLPAALEALRHQIHITPNLYEVIVLLNNCTDASGATVRAFQAQHPTFHLYLAERTLPPDIAHVGTARRLLMDTAWHRLQHRPNAAILSTDADTTVSPDWIARNLNAIEDGAEVVGGVIRLNPADIAHLDPGTLHAYSQDRRYQRLVARLESLLDSDPADPWPRHLEHFGASLACTPGVYARAGGLPPVKPLEDVAFIDACRRVDARIRHAPDVSIVTSARFEGRAEMGLSGQLRRWKKDAAANRPHLVQTAAYLAHRFTSLARLRRIHAFPTLPPLAAYPQCWHEPLRDHHPRRLSQCNYLAAIDCDRLIDETFYGRSREDQVHRVLAALNRIITRLTEPAPAPPAETSPAVSTAPYATPAG